MKWSMYLAKGAEPVIYHMCEVALYHKLTENDGLYFPPTFDQDKFIHATEDPAMLLEVGSHFYKNSIGEWICLKLNPALVGGPVVYEAPAPVGNIEAKEYENSPKFPHIYGGIPPVAVIQQYEIVRGEDGSFLAIKNLR